MIIFNFHKILFIFIELKIHLMQFVVFELFKFVEQKFSAKKRRLTFPDIQYPNIEVSNIQFRICIQTKCVDPIQAIGSIPQRANKTPSSSRGIVTLGFQHFSSIL